MKHNRLAAWSPIDVKNAEAAIVAACPGIKTERVDFSLGLLAYWPGEGGEGFIVFRPCLPSRGDTEPPFRADLETVIEGLKQCKPQQQLH
jgi:hypothetical protein